MRRIFCSLGYVRSANHLRVFHILESMNTDFSNVLFGLNG